MTLIRSPAFLLTLLLAQTTARRLGGGPSFTGNMPDTHSQWSEIKNFVCGAGGTATCQVSCSGADSAKLEMYLVGSSWGETFTGSDGSGCGITVSGQCQIETTYLDYKVEASNQQDLQVYCSCSNSGGSGGGGNPDLPAGSGRVSGCFSGESTVQAQGKKDVTMKNLRVGDKVLTGSGKYQPVYAFGHRHESQKETFFRFYTHAATTTLEMTGNHLVFVMDGNQRKPIRADAVKVGDQVILGLQKPVSVTKISTTQKEGLYMPLTADGTVVVDGILASSYVSLQDEAPVVVEHSKFFPFMSEDRILHWWLSPYRMLCLGISSNYCEGGNLDEEGILEWLLIGKSFAEFAEKQGFFVRVIVLGVPTLLIFAISNLVEVLLRAPVLSLFNLLVLTVAAFYFAQQKRHQSVGKRTAVGKMCTSS